MFYIWKRFLQAKLIFRRKLPRIFARRGQIIGLKKLSECGNYYTIYKSLSVKLSSSSLVHIRPNINP